MAMPSDLEIARQAQLKPITEIAKGMGIEPRLLEPYGDSVAKIKLDAIAELADRPKAKYVVVSAITPDTRSAKARRRRPSGSARPCTTSASAPRSRSASRRWARRSASRGAQPAAATARRCPWRRSTST